MLHIKQQERQHCWKTLHKTIISILMLPCHQT